MKRTFLHFNVRRYSEMPIEKMAAKVGQALGCTFTEEEFNDNDIYAARFLGLHVHLSDWLGHRDRVVFILASVLDEPRLVTNDGFEIIEISDAIADLLTVREGGKWRQVTPEEADAEREHSSRITARFRRQEAAADWIAKHRKNPGV